MASVFISYARSDAQFVRDQLLVALRQLGYTIWIDLDSIPGSTEWWTTITKSIANASAVIVVLSPASCTSSYVAQELNQARSCQRPILPVLMQECQLPDPLAWLNPIEWIDFTKEQFHTALGRLDNGLRYVGITPVPPTPTPPPPLPVAPPKPLSEAIFGTWRIDMQYQQVQYSLQVSIIQGYRFSGLLFRPPGMVPCMYSGSWRVDEPHEVFLDGCWTAPLDFRSEHFAVQFYIQSISDTKLEGFNPPDRTESVWRRL